MKVPSIMLVLVNECYLELMMGTHHMLPCMCGRPPLWNIFSAESPHRLLPISSCFVVNEMLPLSLNMVHKCHMSLDNVSPHHYTHTSVFLHLSTHMFSLILLFRQVPVYQILMNYPHNKLKGLMTWSVHVMVRGMVPWRS